MKNAAHVDNEHWANKLVSQYRLRAYSVASGNDMESAFHRYVADAIAAGDLMIWLHLAEISLRNAISRELDAAYGTERDGWMANPSMLIDSDALTTFRKTIGRIQGSRKALSPPTVISSLPFGFWVKLLSGRYESTLWTRALHKAFAAEDKVSRAVVYDCVNKIYNLRNRVAHHDLVPKSTFAGHKSEVLKLLAWLSPEGYAWAQKNIKP
ncbi:MAG: hypothetical protein RJA66_608 [Actinomycetota bacterium]|jgi:hypothetical protein